jgi:signal transduction histidine kinase
MQAQLVEDLLDVSRIVSGKLPLDIQPVDLVSVVRAAVEAVRPAAANKNIELAVNLGEPQTIVSGDAGRLQQAVWNLLTNSVKFTPRKGRIDIALRRTSSDAMLTVHDTGSGIPSEALPFIFDRFRQADSRTTRAHGGLGLGLTIVEHLAEAHGGAVRADSAGARAAARPSRSRFPIREGQQAAEPATGSGPPHLPDLDGLARALRGRRPRRARDRHGHPRAVRRGGRRRPDRSRPRWRGSGCSPPTCSSATSACRARTATT